MFYDAESMISTLEDASRACLNDMQLEASEGVNIVQVSQAIADFLKEERI